MHITNKSAGKTCNHKVKVLLKTCVNKKSQIKKTPLKVKSKKYKIKIDSIYKKIKLCYPKFPPTWVHFDERQVPSGYPNVRQGSRGVYVCVLQDALNTIGYDTGGLDGVFGIRTQSSVISFQNKNGLVADGIVGPRTWNVLMPQIVGKGASPTTVLPN